MISLTQKIFKLSKLSCVPHLAVCFCVLLSGMPLFAQAQQPKIFRGNEIPNELYPQHLRPQPKLSTKEQQTIERALADLESENVEFRAGAVMLLGKYEARNARNAVIAALEDEHKRVRRAALVSVVEWSRAAPIQAVEPVLRLLGDDDVEIRRSASSSVQTMMFIRQTQRLTTMGRQGAAPLAKDIQDTIITAFLDEDVVVRRNMISHYSLLGFRVPDDTFLQLLQDPDRQVRIKALPLASRYVEPDRFIKAAAEMIEDPEKTIRLKLVREVFMHGGQGGKELLGKMLEDAEPEVAVEAGLWRFQMNGEAAIYNLLVKQFNNQAMKQSQMVRFIQLTPLLGDAGSDYIEAYLDLDSATLRLEAVRIFLGQEVGPKQTARVADLIEDRSINVRDEVLDYIQLHASLHSPELLEKMLFSEHKDVRKALVKISNSLSAEQQEEYLMELLIDEEAEIRISTIQQISAARMDGWLNILKNSLHDSNTDIQKVAAGILIRARMPEARTILNKYIVENPNSPLTSFINNRMPSRPRNPPQAM